MVSLYDEFGAFIANLGFTDNSGVIMFADFTLSPGGYWFQAGATGYMINRVSYLLRRSWESQKTKTHGNITSVGRIYTSTSRSGDILETLTMIAANYCTQIKNTKLKFLCTLTVFVEF